MKTMELLTLLGELDEGAISSSALEQTKRAKRRPLWGAVAACLCACMLGFSAWFFLPPTTVIQQSPTRLKQPAQDVFKKFLLLPLVLGVMNQL